MISEDDLIWLAGLLEGEGSFLAGVPSSPNRPAISLMMTDFDVVQHVAALMEVHVYSYPGRSSNAKTTHQCVIRGKRAVEIMQALYSLMSTRRRGQIDRAMASYNPSGKSSKRLPLSEGQVLEIYKRAIAGESSRVLAQEFKVSNANVKDIKRGRSWAWLTGHKKRDGMR